MSVTSGRTSGRQFAFYDRDTSSWRMWPATGLWGSIEFSETWPRTGCMSGGRAFELPTSVPPIIGSGCSSSPHLPTPRAQAREHPYAREDYHSNLEEWVGHWMEGSLDSTFTNSGAPTPPLFDVGSD